MQQNDIFVWFELKNAEIPENLQGGNNVFSKKIAGMLWICAEKCILVGGREAKSRGAGKKRRLGMYIDAGTGSMLLQAGLAAFFTAAVFWKNLLAWCRTHLGGTAGPER